MKLPPEHWIFGGAKRKAWNSTIDTWMIDAFYPTLRKASTAKEWEGIKGKLMSNVVSYRYMSQLVASEAKKLGLLPHELQAIIWVSMQIIDVVLILVLIYSAVGLVFGLYFIMVSAKKNDIQTSATGKGFWFIIYPGCILLWPVLLSRIIKKK